MTTLNKIRQQQPLIHHLTNWVTIYDCAQATRAVGALPIMAHAQAEVEEMTQAASALVLNIGTLTPSLITSMIKAAKVANQKNIPVVLDAVGCGATNLRTSSTLKILTSCRVDILKGNASEIATIAGDQAKIKGVEAIAVKGNLKKLAQKVATDYNNTVVITGKTDIIATKNQIEECQAGHEMMGQVVGTGCMATSVLACFAAVNKNYLNACVEALNYYGQAGEKAAQTTQRPLAFKMNLIDNLSQ